LHESALTLLKVLIASHICGVLWHKFIRKDNVFESMAGQRLSNFMSRANKLRQG
jgi:cytochrome b561